MGFEPGNIVTVVNENDIMYGFQGEVVTSSFDDEDTFEIMVIVKFPVNIVGLRKDLVQYGKYYEGVQCPWNTKKFAYQDRSPNPSSIRLDESGYTEENKKKMGLLSEVAV